MAATDQAIDGIRELIASGEFRAGDRLPKENALAARIGVSRGSLREAIRALELVGVVDARQGAGTYLTSLTPALLLDVMSVVLDFTQDESILQLLEIRRVLEPAATALAAARATEEELDDVRAAMDAMRRARDPEPLVEADAAFHSAIAHAAGNPALASLLDNLSGPTIRARVWHAIEEQRAGDEAKADHERILAALEARDPELSRAASAVHVAGVEEWLRGAIERRRQRQERAPSADHR